MIFDLMAGKIERGTSRSAAFDLFYAGKEPLLIGDKPIAVPTGVKTHFPPDLVAIIKEKSGLGSKGLEVKGGVIDSDYCEEWKVILRFPMTFKRSWFWGWCEDPKWEPFCILPGMKVAQFIVFQLPKIDYVNRIGTEIIFGEKVRSGGFGSTGF